MSSLDSDESAPYLPCTLAPAGAEGQDDAPMNRPHRSPRPPRGHLERLLELLVELLLIGITGLSCSSGTAVPGCPPGQRAQGEVCVSVCGAGMSWDTGAGRCVTGTGEAECSPEAVDTSCSPGQEPRSPVTGGRGDAAEPSLPAPAQVTDRVVKADEGVVVPAGGAVLDGFVPIPAGTFLMGSPAEEVGRDRDEDAVMMTLTRGLAVSPTEVTQAEWREAMGSGPSRFGGCPECPVEGVNWFEALEYANARSVSAGLTPCYTLSGCEGEVGGGCEWSKETRCEGGRVCSGVAFVGASCDGYRLPTEAEWEYVARAGSGGARYGEADEVAWHVGNSGGKTWPVGCRPPNGWGLYDMLGNVAEWTFDPYAHWPKTPTTDWVAEGDGSRRVRRGGGFFDGVEKVRAAERLSAPAGLRDHKTGLRLVRTLAVTSPLPPPRADRGLLSADRQVERWKASLDGCALGSLRSEDPGDEAFALAWVWSGTAPDRTCGNETSGIVATRLGTASWSASCLGGASVAELTGDGRPELLITHVDCAGGPTESLELEIFSDEPGGPRELSFDRGALGEDILGIRTMEYRGRTVVVVETGSARDSFLDTDKEPESREHMLRWEGERFVVEALPVEGP